MVTMFTNWRFWLAVLLALAAGWKAYADGMSGGGGGGGSNTPYVPVGMSYVAGNSYAVQFHNLSAIGAAQVVGTIYCEPFYVRMSVHIDNLNFNVTTLFATGNVQVALYNDNAGTPGTLIASSASVSTATTGVKSAAITSSAIVGPTNIWACEATDNATNVMRAVSSASGAAGNGPWLIGNTGTGNLDGSGGIVACISFTGQTFGTWPNLTGVPISNYSASANCPVLTFHAASVP